MMIAVAIKPACMLLVAAFLLVAGVMNLSDPFITGEIDGCEYDIKVYDQPSKHGIDGGCISKLTIRKDRDLVANYDRGWDIEPEGEAQEIVDRLQEQYGGVGDGKGAKE